MRHKVFALPARLVREVGFADLASHTANFARYVFREQLYRVVSPDRPTIAAIEVTNFCGRRCSGCYVPSTMRSDKRVMEENLIRQILQECQAAGIRIVGLVGGEPLAPETIPLILSAVGSNPNIYFVVCSNGDHVAKHGLGALQDLHNLSYSISMNGVETTNDALRGRGAFSNAVASFEAFKSARKFFGASVIVRKETMDELAGPYLEFLEDYSAKFVHFMRFKADGPNPSTLTDDEFKGFSELVKQRLARSPIILHFGGSENAGDLSFVKYRYAYFGMTGDVRLTKLMLNENIGNIRQRHLLDMLPHPG